MGIFDFKVVSKKRLQALETNEGQRDILTPSVTQAQRSQGVVDKNNFATYPKQVQYIYECYNSRTEYGSELLKALIDTRVAFIAGEGINVTATKSATKKYIERFLAFNKLNGSRLLTMVQTGEMEGRDLILLLPDAKERMFKARTFSWWVNQYKIETDPIDTDLIKRIYYRPKGEDATEKTLPAEKAVYVKLGGSELRVNETPNRIHCVLTDIENFSRAKYDMRKTSHLFPKIMAFFQTENKEQAKALNNAINADQWEIGKSYAGTAKGELLSPQANSFQPILDEMLSYLKNVSTMMGIPIHWLAYPELMSNRATAENLLESVKAATVKDRLLWEEGFKELIFKSMVNSIDMGFEKNDILGEFEVKLPLIGISALKALQETWIPLQQLDVISMATLQNQVPGIDPLKENKLIEIEKKKNMEIMKEGLMGDSEEEKEDEKKVVE